jgi:hypothetical protein
VAPDTLSEELQLWVHKEAVQREQKRGSLTRAPNMVATQDAVSPAVPVSLAYNVWGQKTMKVHTEITQAKMNLPRPPMGLFRSCYVHLLLQEVASAGF